MAQDNIKKLYDALKDSYDVGSEDSFRAYLADGANREALRNSLKDEYDVGDSASFSRYLGFGKQEEKPKAASGYVYRQTANGDLVPEEEAAAKTNKTAVDTAGTTAARGVGTDGASTRARAHSPLPLEEEEGNVENESEDFNWDL